METFSALLTICAGNSPVPGEVPTQRPVTRSFDVFFDLRLNKRLSKQWWGWWFETLSRPLWRQCNVVICSLHLLEDLLENHTRAVTCHWSQSGIKSMLINRDQTPRRQAYNGDKISTGVWCDFKTKWQPFHRRHYQLHFRDWKWLNLD